MLLAFFSFGEVAEAQHPDSTVTFDRPGVADSPYLVRPNSVQYEMGTAWNNHLGLDEFVFPVMMFRYRIHKRAELRFCINYEPQSAKYLNYHHIKNIDPIMLGTKVKLFKEKKWRPEASIGTYLMFPINGFRKPAISLMEVEIVSHFQNNFTSWFDLNYNFGYVYGGLLQRSSFEYAVCANFHPWKKFSLFIEHYGFYHQSGGYEPAWDAGLIFKPKKNLQLDLSVLQNYWDRTFQTYYMIGFSFNYQWKKKQRPVR